MKAKKYFQLRNIILILVLTGAFAGIFVDFIFLALISIGLGMVVMSFLKTQVNDTLIDERLEDIDGKASKMSFKVLMPILGITSLFLLHTGEGPFQYLHSLGIIFAYITIVGVLIYLISYLYFKRIYGG